MSRSDLQFWIIQAAKIERTLSCLSLYRVREKLDPQFDKTCLLLWTFWHSGHSGSVDFPHLTRFEAVGSCCWSALRTNLYRGDASFSTSFAHLHRVVLLNAWFIASNIRPWIASVLMCLALLWFWIFFRHLAAVWRSLFSRMMLSMVVFFADANYYNNNNIL